MRDVAGDDALVDDGWKFEQDVSCLLFGREQ